MKTNPEIWKIQRNTAAALERRLKVILSAQYKAPGFPGKAALIDKLLRAQTLAHNLAFSLSHDCEP
jgi:hypothetical protein